MVYCSHEAEKLRALSGGLALDPRGSRWRETFYGGQGIVTDLSPLFFSLHLGSLVMLWWNRQEAYNICSNHVAVAPSLLVEQDKGFFK